MDISLVASATTFALANAAVSITHGLTLQIGDVVIASVSANGAGTTITDNNGGTPFTESWYKSHPDASSAWSIQVRICGANEPSAYAWTLGTAQDWSVVLRQYRGVYVATGPAGVWDVTPSDSTYDHAISGTTATAPSIRILTPGAEGFLIGHNDGGDEFNTPTNSYDTLVQQNNRPAIGWSRRNFLNAGATGTSAYTHPASDDWMIQQCALKPAGAFWGGMGKRVRVKAADGMSVADQVS